MHAVETSVRTQSSAMPAMSPWLFAVPVFSFWLFLLALLPGDAFVRDGDTFWHIRTGEWISNHLSVPQSDFYSFTYSGAHWIDGEWLADVIIAAVYRQFGWGGLAFLTACLCALALTILCCYLISTIRFSAAIVWTLVTAFLISPHFLVRPHVFSFVALSLWLTLLVKSWDRDKFEPPIVWLCLIMLFWANLHGSFFFGYALLLVFCACSSFTALLNRDCGHVARLASTALLVGCCAVATPYGLKTAALTFEVLQLKYVLTHVSEWKSPDFQAFWPHMLYLVISLATGLFFGVAMRGPRLFVLCILVILALSHVRGLFLLFLAIPILVAVPLRDKCAWLQDQVLGGQTGLASLSRRATYIRPIQVVAPLLVLTVLFGRWHALSTGPSQSLAPERAVDVLEKYRGTDNVFNSYRFGGYLIFRNIPVFVDSRTPPYSDEFMKRTIRAADAADLGDAFKLLDDYKIGWVLLEPSEPLGKALALSAQWQAVFSDRDAVLLKRANSADIGSQSQLQ